jgi:hypothetical protein
MSRISHTDEELRILMDRAYRGATTWEGKVPHADDGLSEDELRWLLTELSQTPDSARRIRLLSILEYAGTSSPGSSRPVLESLLAGPDSLAASSALRILCWSWGSPPNYIEQLRSFIRGVPWDPYGYLRRDALRLAADYLRFHKHSVLQRDIVDLYEQVADDEGPDHSELFNTLYEIVGCPDVSKADVLRRIRNRLAEEDGQATD